MSAVLYQALFADPIHLILEALCVIIIVYLFLQRSYNPKVSKQPKLSDREVEGIVRDWQPAPLVPVIDDHQSWKVDCTPTITSGTLPTATLLSGSDHPLLNFASTNFLSLATNDEVKKAAIETLRKYGCGSCGPRLFYGTMDIHLALEDKLASFMRTEEAIIYSSSFATVGSAIPAFSNRNDLIFCDKGVHFPLQTGCFLSRSRIVYFEHNDVKDLERKLREVEEEERREKKKHTSYRTYLVIEGVYTNYGDICPLLEFIKLKHKYKFRIMLDDSNGIGTIGNFGRGTVEYWGADPKEVEVLMGSLGTALGSDGGFCCGSKSVVTHQRLNASGYVFSASSPPFLVTGAIRAVEIIEQAQGKLQHDLKRNITEMNEALKGVFGLRVEGDGTSPIIHLRLAKGTQSRFSDEMSLQTIVDLAREKGVLLTRATYVEIEKFLPSPSIRLAVSVAHSSDDIKNAVDVLKEVSHKVLG